MAVVRDPAFWRRFSMAVHLDEENQGGDAASPNSSRPPLKHSDSWLDRQNAKKSRRTCICWIFWMAFFVLVAGIVIVILWLKANGMLGAKSLGSNEQS